MIIVIRQESEILLWMTENALFDRKQEIMCSSHVPYDLTKSYKKKEIVYSLNARSFCS